MDSDLITGQWTGRISGLNNGRVTVESEATGNNIVLDIYFYDDEGSLPNFFCKFISISARSITQKVSIRPFDKQGRILSEADFNLIYPAVEYQTEIQISLDFDQNSLRIRAESRKGISEGTATRRSVIQVAETSAERAELVTWHQFKSAIDLLPLRVNIFRGQGQPWPLKTSFHRTKRSSIQNYLITDVHELRHAFASTKPQFLKHEDPSVLLSFLGFLQHHGYPTPLLDWTYSPYIAAFFAAHDLQTTHIQGGRMRIFCFDWMNWEPLFPRVDQFVFRGSHFSPVRAFLIENERAVAQQSVFAMTNIEDIEGYLYFCESFSHRRFLRIFDISHTERDIMLNDLEMMGITAASLFPGPEGICRAERRRRFDTYK
jgi:hypothetical protein